MVNLNQNKRSAKLQWVPLGAMRVSPLAQRKYNQAWADAIASAFDPEELGNPTVNRNSDGTYNIIDGQHRVAAMRQWFGDGCDTQQIQCWVYDDLPEATQAEKFLKLNNNRTVNAFYKFKVAVTAGRPVECAINAILTSCGLVLANHKTPGGVGAVTALRRVYERSSGDILSRALTIIRDAFGDSGFDSVVIEAVGYICQRYNGVLDDQQAISALASVNAGVAGLMNRAQLIRSTVGNSLPLCLAAACVEAINRKIRGRKLKSWWKVIEDEK